MEAELNKIIKDRNYKLTSIQFLRFLAATMVLITHVSAYIHRRIDSQFSEWPAGAGGVLLFFVISGFIMTINTFDKYRSPHIAEIFMISRIIRIAPLYWTVNFLKIIGLLIVPGMIMASPTISSIIYSLIFLPARNANGQIEAFYGVGWTLNFEMFFYVLFALALRIHIRPSILVVPILIVAVYCSDLKDETWPTFTYYISPYLIFFIWGIIIGEVYILVPKISFIVSSMFIIFGIILIMAFELNIYTHNKFYITYLQPQYAAIVFGLVALERELGLKIPKILIFLGDASYSLYLTHPIIGVFCVVVLSQIKIIDSNIIFIVSCSITIIIASYIYVYYEKPISTFLSKKFIKSMVINNS